MDSERIKELVLSAGGTILPKTIKSIPEKKKASTIALMCIWTKDNKEQLKVDIRAVKKLGFDKIYTI